MKPYMDDTIVIAESRAEEIKKQFLEEVRRLLKSLDPEDHNRGLLFGVALENIADGFLRGERYSRDYKNLKQF